jgi:cell division septation protein DedD
MRKMKKLFGLIFSFTVILMLPSCASKEVTKDNTSPKDSVYVFDQVVTDTVKQKIPPPVESSTIRTPYYLIQLGAFSTRDKAESFSELAKTKMNYDLTIKLNDAKGLYVVQLSPPFTSRSEAEKVRDQIKQIYEYRDVWIVTEDK